MTRSSVNTSTELRQMSNPIPININTWQIRSSSHLDDSTQFDPGITDQFISQNSVSPSSAASYSFSPTMLANNNNSTNNSNSINNPSIYINQFHLQQQNQQQQQQQQPLSERHHLINDINLNNQLEAALTDPYYQTISDFNITNSIDLESLLVNTTLSDQTNIGLISEPPSCGEPDHLNTAPNSNQNISNDYMNSHSNNNNNNNNTMQTTTTNTTSPASSTSSNPTSSSISSSLSSHHNLNEDLVVEQQATNNINPMFLFKSNNQTNKLLSPVMSKTTNSISIKQQQKLNQRSINPSKIDEEDIQQNQQPIQSGYQYQKIRNILSNNSKFSTNNNNYASMSSHPMSLPTTTGNYLSARFNNNNNNNDSLFQNTDNNNSNNSADPVLTQLVLNNRNNIQLQNNTNNNNNNNNGNIIYTSNIQHQQPQQTSYFIINNNNNTSTLQLNNNSNMIQENQLHHNSMSLPAESYFNKVMLNNNNKPITIKQELVEVIDNSNSANVNKSNNENNSDFIDNDDRFSKMQLSSPLSSNQFYSSAAGFGKLNQQQPSESVSPGLLFDADDMNQQKQKSNIQNCSTNNNRNNNTNDMSDVNNLVNELKIAAIENNIIIFSNNTNNNFNPSINNLNNEEFINFVNKLDDTDNLMSMDGVSGRINQEDDEEYDEDDDEEDEYDESDFDDEDEEEDEDEDDFDEDEEESEEEDDARSNKNNKNKIGISRSFQPQSQFSLHFNNNNNRNIGGGNNSNSNSSNQFFVGSYGSNSAKSSSQRQTQRQPPIAINSRKHARITAGGVDVHTVSPITRNQIQPQAQQTFTLSSSSDNSKNLFSNLQFSPFNNSNNNNTVTFSSSYQQPSFLSTSLPPTSSMMILQPQQYQFQYTEQTQQQQFTIIDNNNNTINMAQQHPNLQKLLISNNNNNTTNNSPSSNFIDSSLTNKRQRGKQQPKVKQEKLTVREELNKTTKQQNKKRHKKQQDIFEEDFEEEDTDDFDDNTNDLDEDLDDSEQTNSNSNDFLKMNIKMESDMTDPNTVNTAIMNNLTSTTTKSGRSKKSAGGTDSASTSYNNSDSLFDLMMSTKNRDSYFWQYNIQSKGPKTKKVLTLRNKDPHLHRDFFDPVFQLQSLNSRNGGASLNKLRKGDGNDVTPNADKLYNLGNQIRDFIHKSYQMNSACFTPQQQQAINNAFSSSSINQLASTPNNPSMLSISLDNGRGVGPVNLKREKNKIASRACRLKKKAQHEANKIKLHGLNEEHKELIDCINAARNLIKTRLTDPQQLPQDKKMIELIDEIISQKSITKVAGNTDGYVHSLMVIKEKERSSNSNDGKSNMSATGKTPRSTAKKSTKASKLFELQQQQQQQQVQVQQEQQQQEINSFSFDNIQTTNSMEDLQFGAVNNLTNF